MIARGLFVRHKLLYSARIR